MKRVLALLVMALMLTSAAFAVQPYPTAVQESGEGDFRRIEKVYPLKTGVDPASIPTADFEREGYHYTLLDLLREDKTKTDSTPHTETVTLDSATQDVGKILEGLDMTMEYTGEDGYSGTLVLDSKSVTVTAAGYKTSTKTVTAHRTYPGLSDADTALIPKTIEENGKTLELAGMNWQTVPGSNDTLPITYTATATYSGTASNSYATGYTVTAEYTGELTRTVDGGAVYTAVFTGEPVEQTAPEETETPAGHWLEYVPFILTAVVVLALAAWGIWCLIKRRRNRRYCS